MSTDVKSLQQENTSLKTDVQSLKQETNSLNVELKTAKEQVQTAQSTAVKSQQNGDVHADVSGMISVAEHEKQ